MNRKRNVLLLTLVGVVFLGVRYVKADFTFGEPVNLKEVIPIIDPVHESIDCFSYDGLEIYIESERPGGFGDYDIWRLRRNSADEDWGAPENLGPAINTWYSDADVTISSDGLTLYFASHRPGGSGSQNIYITTRTTRKEPWGEADSIGQPINSPYDDVGSCITADGLELYFSSERPGGYGGFDIYVSKRATHNESWGDPENLGPVVNSASNDWSPIIATDGLVLFFSSTRSDGYGNTDIWMTRRASFSDPWEPPVNLGSTINSLAYETWARISPDGSTLYFVTRAQNGTWDNWQVPIMPIVDFNSDGIVNAADVCIMIEHWLTDYPLCDIGPMPWGDGIVDVQDLIVLAEHLFEDYRLITHWALDEEAGNIAYDSVGGYDANLHGEPTWQTTSGKEGGALQFDGLDDYVSTPFVLDPSKGSFSTFAWIKGGTRGQVILSQRDTVVGQSTKLGNSWLWADSSYGRLITRIMHPPFDPLISESVITDGQWHHVGLVYDIFELRRYLYVDGVKVAQDNTFVGTTGSDGGLYIGAGESLVPTSFFSGLIDDVRIYNAALSPEEVAALSH